MILNSLAPHSFAAVTKGSALKDINFPRTTQANPVQEKRDKIIVIPK